MTIDLVNNHLQECINVPFLSRIKVSEYEEELNTSTLSILIERDQGKIVIGLLIH
jgi:hypothetical protein